MIIGTRPGRAIWQHLVALVAVPLVATAVLSVGVVRTHLQDVERARTAQELLDASLQLDVVRRAVDTEMLPALALVVARDDAASARAGLDPEQRAQLLRDTPALLSASRASTDRVLLAVTRSRSTEVVGAVTVALSFVRSAADQQGTALVDVVTGYVRAGDALRLAVDEAAVRAASAGLTARSASSVNDVRQVVELTGLHSRQLPLAFAVSALAGEDRATALALLRAEAGGYHQVLPGVAALSTQALQTRWAVAVGSDLSARVDEAVATVTADDASTAAPLTGAGVLALRADEADLAGQLAGLLHTAVTSATSAAHDDSDASHRALSGALALCVLAMLASGLSTAVVAHGTARPLRRLAEAARRAVEGEPLDLPDRGPREVREVGAALQSTAEGLMRVRQQAEAVARGDLGAALAHTAVPGRLGRVVHESVEAVVRAVEARDELRAELVHRATHDPLTGLPNRAAALSALGEAVERARSLGGSVSVLFVDLDGFKLVNDRCGHAAGDAVLVAVAARLRAQFRGDDVVARLGGDEFVVVAPDTDAETARRLGVRLVAAAGEPVEVEVDGVARTVRVGASTGVAVSVDGLVDAQAVLAQADAAVYRAKAQGRGCVVVHDDELARQQTDQEALVGALRAALAGDASGGDALEVRWEPLVDPLDGTPLAWCAEPHLVRDGGEVPGPALQRTAQAAGLARDLGRWLLGAATARVVAWRQEPPVPVVVRLAAPHVTDERLVDDVTEALAAAGLGARALALEVPEPVLTDPAALAALRSLRATGVDVRVAASGTTPLRDLPALPVDVLTVASGALAGADPGQRSVVALLCAAARELGVPLVATGVASEHELQRAAAAGAVQVSGPVVTRPLDDDQAGAWAGAHGAGRPAGGPGPVSAPV